MVQPRGRGDLGVPHLVLAPEVVQELPVVELLVHVGLWHVQLEQVQQDQVRDV